MDGAGEDGEQVVAQGPEVEVAVGVEEGGGKGTECAPGGQNAYLPVWAESMDDLGFDHEISPIARRILLIRGKRVIIDVDLAQIYGVPTKRLNEQVKRNAGRFPDDFAFALCSREKAEVVAKCDHLHNLKYSNTLPMAFTEHGAIMAATVLKSERAIEMSVFIIRAFVRLRQYLVENKELADRISELERIAGAHDRQIAEIVDAIKVLIMTPADQGTRRIGFNIED